MCELTWLWLNCTPLIEALPIQCLRCFSIPFFVWVTGWILVKSRNILGHPQSTFPSKESNQKLRSIVLLRPFFCYNTYREVKYLAYLTLLTLCVVPLYSSNVARIQKEPLIWDLHKSCLDNFRENPRKTSIPADIYWSKSTIETLEKGVKYVLSYQ